MSPTPKTHVLVTGGAVHWQPCCGGFARSRVRPVLLDNLHNSEMQAVDGVRELCGHEVPFHAIDVRDASALESLFRECTEGGNPIQGILHFAAHRPWRKRAHPAMYASNNVGGLGTLLQVANAFDVRNVVFSSSCTV